VPNGITSDSAARMQSGSLGKVPAERIAPHHFGERQNDDAFSLQLSIASGSLMDLIQLVK
jgi:hypothetical protein